MVIEEEAEKKRAEAKQLSALLKSKAKRWKLIRKELNEIRDEYADERRSRIVRSQAKEPEFSAEDFIADIPQTTGYGAPIQRLFKLSDGEKLAGALAFDPRLLDVPPATEDAEPEEPYAVAVTRLGMALRFSLRNHREPSTRNGRKFARLKPGDEVIAVFPCDGLQYVMAASDDGHAIAVDVEDIPLLSGAGKGNMLIKLGKDVELIGAIGEASVRDAKLVAYTPGGRRHERGVEALLTSRGGRGKAVVKRNGFDAMDIPLPEIPMLEGES